MKTEHLLSSLSMLGRQLEVFDNESHAPANRREDQQNP